MFEGVERPKDPDLAVAKRPALVEIGGDPAAVQIDRLVTRSRVDTAAKVDPPQPILITLAFEQRINFRS